MKDSTNEGRREIVDLKDYTDKGCKQVIDPTSLNWCDMALLKKKDPFMYYSIPGNRDEELPGKDVDLSELDLPSDVSRSFTVGAPKKDQNVEPRRNLAHSLTMERRGTGTNFEFALKCLPIEEDEKHGINHPRCKSSNDSAKHRRVSTCSSDGETKLVERKSTISYESYVDTVLERVIEEQAAILQPNAPKRTYGDSDNVDELRRGSILEDILFESIAQLGNFDGFDSDTESETESD